MKKIVFITIFICCFLMILPSNTSAQQPEKILDFSQNTTINLDGTVDIRENITYDFGDYSRHGIYRTIPYTKINADQKKYKMTFSDFSVNDENGQNYNFKKTTTSKNIELKIGDPDKTISGVHTYEISYRVAGALTYFSDHDELYWNVTGNDWVVPIDNIESIIELPKEIEQRQINTQCFSGVFGSEKPCDFDSKSIPIKFSQQQLKEAQGLTIVVGFPKGTVALLEPTPVVDFFDTVMGKLVLIGLLLGALMWYFVYPVWIVFRWWVWGRDPEGAKGEIHVSFEPPRLKADHPLDEKNNRFLTPAETGAILDEKVESRELVATVVSMAQKGYLKIVETSKNKFELQKQEKSDLELSDFEKILYFGLFGMASKVDLEKGSLVETFEDTTNSIYAELVHGGYFPENPDKIRQYYKVITTLASLSFNLFLILSSSIFGRIMPKKTLKGVKMANLSRALKKFLTSQERQLEFQADKQMMFEKLLPYAIAFGVEKVWAKRFKDIALRQPEWFSSRDTTVFNVMYFSSSLNSSLKAVTSAATPIQSSSGFSSGFSGGSSGGGGGGGGGGSW